MLIYVWAYEQEHKKFATQDVFVPWHLHDTYDAGKKKTKSNSSQASQEESKTSTQTPFIETAIEDKDKQSTVYHRYYHVFREGELENLIVKNFAGKL